MREGTVRVISEGEFVANPIHTRVEVWVGDRWVRIPVVKSIRFDISAGEPGLLTLELFPQSVVFTCDLIKQVKIQRVPTPLALINPALLIYAHGNYGRKLTDVLERDKSVFVNDGEVTNIKDHSPPPGHFVYSDGYVRMGGTPVGELTAVFE